jgi:hypothetical protein
LAETAPTGDNAFVPQIIFRTIDYSSRGPEILRRQNALCMAR